MAARIVSMSVTAQPLAPASSASEATLLVPPVEAPRPAAFALEPARELWIGAHFAQLAEASRLAHTPHDLRSVHVVLERLAVRAQRFTPRVSLVPPDGLVLEVKGSLALFGGISPLGAALLAAYRTAGARPSLALAPTALAALAGARCVALAGPRAKPFKVVDEARLVGALAPLPLEVLRWPVPVIERLGRMGVRTIGAALRLPRAGFARRLGAETLASLDRLVGRAADPRPVFQARERFRMRRACGYEIAQHDAILVALAPLIEQLGRFLQARQCGITALDCRLWHRHARPTRCVLNLVAPAADPRHLQTLLGERLAALTLPEPVRACELRSGRLVPLELATGTLWQPGEHGGEARALAESTQLIESLSARLGADAVHGLCVHPTHRPEAASRQTAPDCAERASDEWDCGSVPWPACRRPTWLLSVPQPLAEKGGWPRHRGPLRLLGGPERIETGWWEGADVARDYYRVIDTQGVRLWVFRERVVPHRWFLHGIFG